MTTTVWTFVTASSGGLGDVQVYTTLDQCRNALVRYVRDFWPEQEVGLMPASEVQAIEEFFDADSTLEDGHEANLQRHDLVNGKWVSTPVEWDSLDLLSFHTG